MQYTLATNGIGVCKLMLPPTFPLSFVQEDSRLLIWRQVPGGRKYLDGDAVWLIRDWEETINRQGQQEYTLLAYTASEILDRAIIAYSQGSSQGSKASAPLDNIVKALVRENLGTLATDTARNISAYLVVEADLSLGPSAPKTAPWRKLLPTLRELAQTADDLGTRIFFDVVHGSPLLLRTYRDQRGINHGPTSGQRVILSTRNGTIAEIRRSYNSSGERNVIYLGGSSTQIDTARTGISPLNRRESFLDAGNMTSAQLTAEGQAALRNYRPKESFTIKIRDTVGIRYGREYGFGDRLAAEVGNRLAEVRLDAVEVVMEGGRETINGDLRVDE